MENREMCPTIFAKGDKIVEVALTEWRQTGSQRWGPVDAEVTVGLLEPIDRIIFETPVGCFQIPTNCQAGSSGGTGDTMTLYLGPNSELRQSVPFEMCRSKPGFVEAEETTWTKILADVTNATPKITAKSGKPSKSSWRTRILT